MKVLLKQLQKPQNVIEQQLFVRGDEKEIFIEVLFTDQGIKQNRALILYVFTKTHKTIKIKSNDSLTFIEDKGGF